MSLDGKRINLTRQFKVTMKVIRKYETYFIYVMVIDERAMCLNLLDVSHYKQNYFFKKVIFEYKSLNILDENVCI
jgi:hypothetical protein